MYSLNGEELNPMIYGNIESFVQSWLAEHFKTSEKEIDKLLKCQTATLYLLIWPVMEQRLFSGFMKQNEILNAAKKYSPYYEQLSIDSDVEYFFYRYQKPNLYRHLKHGRYFCDTDKILKKEYYQLTSVEKLQLMFFVVYRYRNNIFHGSKGIESWIQYSEQIKKCIVFMTKIVDCQKKNFPTEQDEKNESI